jgi:hypothetical protein
VRNSKSNQLSEYRAHRAATSILERLKDPVAERKKQEAEWFARQDPETVIDSVFEAREILQESASLYVDGMTDAQVEQRISNPSRLQLDGELGEVIYKNVMHLPSSYRRMADIAYGYFQGNRHSPQSALGLIGIVKALEDPVLANAFRSDMDQSVDLKIATRSASDARYNLTMREKLSATHRVGGILLLGIQGLRQGPGQRRNLNEWLIEPLERISALPPVEIQLVNQALHSRALRT